MSKRNTLFIWLSVLVVASMLLAACGGAATQPPAEQPTQAAPAEQPTQPPAEQPTEAAPAEQPTEAPAMTEAPAAERKVVTLIWTQEFDTLNPLYTNMWFVSSIFPVYACQRHQSRFYNNP
ncbi:MAG: hypothetical protein ACWGO1_07275, partial [Anaerolineales bacterium]